MAEWSIDSRGGRGKRKPAALRRLEGNPGRIPIRPEIEVEPGIPDPPRSLRGEALREWRRIVPHLARLGILTTIDRAALIGYCRAFARAEAAEEYLDRHGTVYENENGRVWKRPQVEIAAEAWMRCRQFLGEFGLSPSSRSRVAPAPKPDDPKGAAKFFQ